MLTRRVHFDSTTQAYSDGEVAEEGRRENEEEEESDDVILIIPLTGKTNE